MQTVIQKMQDVLFIVSAIEIHGAAHPVAKKPKVETYDGSKGEKPRNFNKAIDLSNPRFYQEESDRLREARSKKDRMEDEIRRTMEQKR